MMKRVMVRAHEIARTLDGDYAARMAEALRIAWREVKLVAAGGSVWEKNNMHRIYFNGLPTWYGLKVDRYNTGNICDAWLNGQSISNSEGRRIEGRLCMSKVWYDVTTGRFAGRDISDADLHVIVESIRTAARVA